MSHILKGTLLLLINNENFRKIDTVKRMLIVIRSNDFFPT